jgi:hypothetical protein
VAARFSALASRTSGPETGRPTDSAIFQLANAKCPIADAV